MKITIIAGARPNFMKIAPIIDAIELRQQQGYPISYRLVHTGQHYDANMSQSFFEQLGIPQPHVNLEAGGGSQAEQTAGIMVKFEKDLAAHPCDLVLVVGDVTSTLACSIVAKKMKIKVAHVEAGIRSGDQHMPEEINRMVTDAITDYFFTTSEIANGQLRREGKTAEQLFFVGNTMIDTLLKHRSRFHAPPVWRDAGLQPQQYLVMTLHRPANVDEEAHLGLLISEIMRNNHGLPVVFPVHPRTAKQLERIAVAHPRLHLTPPMGYLEFNYLVERAKAVITDSGGITEETTVMGVPCMTLRDSTERPETCTIGTNVLLGTDPAALGPAMEQLFAGDWKKGDIPPLWDGHAAERIADCFVKLFKLEHQSATVA
ncbi:non-hydrolyzing UDP-N-acetylglucosamine 2-epimerase [Chitinophaga japonensis]|uniref:UDP-N-acetylglucosamine 2-epimerase (Non-hydrolysing) n=1 Tax=Chitinophaga japonensis TaxID=104662 RepID=A0A562T2E3_CHIJA|nr:UDP-N-acetylglucosamine 2-epimerase (non-hydrolyzing) [Chitinophaga japonensis]TWI86930.1 UDP-N-acetylglucosamine 2-epimerase (non-hydrolysing) [Chitinophaga japonensis]